MYTKSVDIQETDIDICETVLIFVKYVSKFCLRRYMLIIHKDHNLVGVISKSHF